MSHLPFIVLLAGIISMSILTNKLTIVAAIVAAILAVVIYAGTGYSGIALLGSFFILGIAATAWKKKVKEKLSPEVNRNKRDAKQVLANGGLAGISGITALFLPEHENLFLFVMACSLSSATADTVSSELGIVHGRQCYNILSFKKDLRGGNGVISIEGILFGLAGSILVAVIFSAVTEWNITSFLIIIIAGTFGNLVDSFLGATLERKNIIGNNAVNFLNTLFAALAGILLLEIS
jgi:uncharacterized protein (TIGR00297 family)